ncbi:MAG TPA: response regulator [Aestuariivirga sp.]|nr:response regulator [Aestuariivirga sp.]
MTLTPHIVVIEDHAVTRMRLVSYLRQQLYRVSEAADAAQAEDIMARNPADLLIVDINLEGKDGLEITREQRARSDVGIILLTARTDHVDRIVGLELGADDYITKPFDPRELAARVKNLLRRVAEGRAAGSQAARPVKLGGWTLDMEARRVMDASGAEVTLTKSEFDLLRHFAQASGMVLSRTRLMQAISHREWNADDRTVDVLVGRLRRKLAQASPPPATITTVHGEGYMFIAMAEGKA